MAKVRYMISGRDFSRPAFAVLAACAVVSCGGTGEDTSAPPPSASSAEDVALAVRLYKGTERTPPDFAVEPRPANVTGVLATRHLTNLDVVASANAGPRFEVCTNDLGEAIAWSERVSTWNGAYTDLSEVNGDERYTEIARVPRTDPSALLRHRTYRCDYLDRSGSDLSQEVGAAGTYQKRPADAAALKQVSEYLWQFTIYNNSDHVVASSTGSTSGNTLRHRIRMAHLTRGTNNSCDTIRVIDWTHVLNADSGGMTREMADVRTFAARQTLTGAELCAR
jgi:hypothetical protein